MMTGLELVTALTELGQEALDKQVVLSLQPGDATYEGSALTSVYEDGDVVMLTDTEVHPEEFAQEQDDMYSGMDPDQQWPDEPDTPTHLRGEHD
jgi:hypothetical protein